MQNILLIGADDVAHAANRMLQAANEMANVASRIESAFQQRQQWEEEYLQRIEAIVDRELAFYKEQPAK